MADKETNGRTHEPSLRELTADLDGVKEVLAAKLDSLQAVMDERDRRYEERFKAMDEKTSLALTASEKAVTKAEIATEKRFDSVNEFRGQLKDQASTLLPRAEAETKFKSYDEKLEDIKKTKTQAGQWLVGIVIAVAALAVSLIAVFVRLR